MRFDFDILVIGGGAAGMSCALILGSSLNKPYAEGRQVGILLHQKASHLQTVLFHNVLGIKSGTTGKEILETGKLQLREGYPEVVQIPSEKALEIEFLGPGFKIQTNKNVYSAEKVVIATGYTSGFTIKGLENYVVPHQKAKPSKERIQLRNEDHLISPGLYVAGTLAGHRSQYSIACGSGAAVATDILTEWNNGEQTKVHDKIS